MRETAETDVVVAGGGFVGAALALALAAIDVRSVVVEARSPSRGGPPGFDDRSIALSNGTRRVLEALGIWPDLAPLATPILSIHVSEQGRFGTTRIEAGEEGVEALGYVVLARDLGALLWERMEAEERIRTFAPATVVATAAEAERRRVELEGAAPAAVSARLLVGADGAESAIRELLDIDHRRYDYGQTAIVANLATTVAHDNRAFERFTPVGPMALLPMPEGRSGLVWTVHTDQAPALLEADDGPFLAAFQAAFGYRLGRLSRLGGRAAYPLSLVRSAEVVAPRAVLLGNAANSLHPVAGQGFNLGVRDVAALVDVLVDAGAERDAGAQALLERYATWRRGDQNKVVAFTDGLVRLFGLPPRAFGTARGLGMLAFDLLPGAKAALARHSMGLAGRLPRLVRGVPLA